MFVIDLSATGSPPCHLTSYILHPLAIHISRIPHLHSHTVPSTNSQLIQLHRPPFESITPPILPPHRSNIQTHAPSPPTSTDSRPHLSVRLTACSGSLHEKRVLRLQDFEFALRVPGPDGVGGEDEIDFFEGTLIGFGVEGVNPIGWGVSRCLY